MGSLEEWQQYSVSEHALEEYSGTKELMSQVKKSHCAPRESNPDGDVAWRVNPWTSIGTWTCSPIVI